MNKASLRILSPFIFVIIVLASLTYVAHAQTNIASGEDARCVTLCAQLAAQKPPQICGQTIMPVCHPPANGGSVTGICMPNGCKGVSFGGGGLSGGSLGMNLLQQALGSLMQRLISGATGGSGSGSSAPTATAPVSTGCSQYYQVTTPSSDPCAYYVPPVSTSLSGTGSLDTSVSDQLLNSLGSDTNTNTNTNVSDILNSTTTAVTTAATGTATIVSTSSVIVPTNATIGLTGGVTGDIKVLDNGATILAGSTDVTSNTTVAGFYGADTFNTQPQGLVANLCQSRPWATNFLSAIIPPTFFDGLCTLRGYKVGVQQATQATPTVTFTQSAPQATTAAAATTTISTVQPKASIWASPANVSLGSRTSIFWTSQGVTSCSETSADGSFSQSTLSGGASTVPITGATVFTISCIAADGSHVTDDVTVNLAI